MVACAEREKAGCISCNRFAFDEKTIRSNPNIKTPPPTTQPGLTQELKRQMPWLPGTTICVLASTIKNDIPPAPSRVCPAGAACLLHRSSADSSRAPSAPTCLNHANLATLASTTAAISSLVIPIVLQPERGRPSWPPEGAGT